MAKVNTLLTQRLQSKPSQMKNLAELSSSGGLSSFSGVFRVSNLAPQEHESLKFLLETHSDEQEDLSRDLTALASLTAEVKAINNQAAILHGERIQKAQAILKNYREGAFTAWLIATYGNRQTPYNFLQYYELYKALPQALHQKIEEMPRQAVYTLASRSGPLEKKEAIIKSYQGEPQKELLSLIRKAFPLAYTDKRKRRLAPQKLPDYAIQTLSSLYEELQKAPFLPTAKQQKTLEKLLQALQALLPQNG